MESGPTPPGTPPGEGPQSPQQPPTGPQPPPPQQQPPGPPPPAPQSPAQFPPAPQPGPEAQPQYPGAPAPQGAPPGGWYQQPGYQQPVKQPPVGIQGRELASWGSRLGAYLIDGLVLAVPALILFFVLIAGAVGISGDEDVQAGAAVGAFLLWTLVMAVIGLLYAPLLMARNGEANGQTWGKQLLNLRVVRDNGQPFNFGTAALREIVLKFLAVFIASSIIPFIPWFLNFFWPLWDDENRALHDMAAQTHVVKA
jgi:uncharacterized RDD family membrane protein YckC